jgi:D-alanyl-D-alanine dipeptidase
MILFDNENIKNVNVNENNEYFVNLNYIHKRIIVDNSMNQIANKSKCFCFCRKTIAELLAKSLKYLPNSISYFVKEAYRPLSIQRMSVKYIHEKYKIQYKNLDENNLLRKVYEYVAPENTAPHPTGGAIDLVLIDNNGKELNMGTKYNAEPMNTQNKTYTYSKLLTKEEIMNRKILIHALEKVDFVNYPSEWWHWSYGDKYWAFIREKDAIYNQIEEEKIKEI